ncbi:MAG TPA: NAD(+)/NADH kinase [Vicinamibacterales bacterium]
MIARVGIVAKAHLQAAGPHLMEIAAWLRTRGVEPVFDPETAALTPGASNIVKADKDLLVTRVDLVLVLGGDGTLLGMAGRIGQAGVDIPILGVNFGGLGFLTEVTLPELYSTLEATLNGSAQTDERMTLRATTLRDQRPFDDRVVLNDVVLTQGPLSRIIDLSVTVEDQFVTRVRADGLIVSTPTGSTAYNLAAGGPILHPQVDGLVITPIAAHTLTNRPLVVPGSAEVRVQPHMDSSRDEVYVTFDGQFGFRLMDHDVVSVRRSARPIRLIRATSRNYFEVLREKLKWGQR